MTRALAVLATAPTLHHRPGDPMTTCWTLTYPCGTDVDTGDGIPHYAAEELAQEEAATYRVPGLGKPVPRRLDRPCITVSCSRCGYVLDEDGPLHFESLAETELTAPDYGWTQRPDGSWRCKTCTAGCDLEADTHG